MGKNIAVIIIFFWGFAFISFSKDFSYKIYNDLLIKNVDNGLVNYSGFKTEKFNKYIDELKAADISAMNENQKLAFWINAYNALTIKNVLDHPGINSPKKVDNFFKEEKFYAAGLKVSLDEIENQIIRKDFKEPLIHFGLVCAAKGCPKIKSEAYTGETVIKNLKENARNYFQSNKGFILDKKNMNVKLTSLMKWFKEDFGNNDKELLDFVMPYISKPDSLFIMENRNKIKVDFIEYNWELNNQ